MVLISANSGNSLAKTLEMTFTGMSMDFQLRFFWKHSGYGAITANG
jgi:hypothetical protein